MVTIGKNALTIKDIISVAGGSAVNLSSDPAVIERIESSRNYIKNAASGSRQIYGITTLFGGMANIKVNSQNLSDLQKEAIWQHKSTTGPHLAIDEIRASMLLRANCLARGASGVRLAIIRRYITFLNAGATPHVHEHGSIGASGDLVPLSYIAGAILGLAPDFKVDMNGETLNSHQALEYLRMEPLTLEPKEGLALNNGTSVSTGVATLCVSRALDHIVLTFGVHALLSQALHATDQSFHPFVHSLKPHPGQLWAAQMMAELIEGSSLIRRNSQDDGRIISGELIQDRYSLRCLPQYLGPIVDALILSANQVISEANSVNDNPLIDPGTGEIFHNGNFLAQYTGTAMDQVRKSIGLIAKHIDSQVALLMTPEFSLGLPPSLVGNSDLKTNVGFKSLQIVGNSLMPLLEFYGQSIIDRYPTHAEQFNQNINSQAMNAANLARKSLDIMDHYLTNSLILATQALDLRALKLTGKSDATELLSPATQPLYRAVRKYSLSEPGKPILWNDMDRFIQPMVEGVLEKKNELLKSLSPILDSLHRKII